MWRRVRAEYYYQIGHWVERLFGHWNWGGALYQKWMRRHWELSE